MSIIERFPGLSDRLVPLTLADIKTMTRRMLARQPDPRCTGAFCGADGIWRFSFPTATGPLSNSEWDVRAPWKAGDFLYVRETHYRYGHWEQTGEYTRKGKPKWAFVPDSDEVLFEAPAGVWRKSRNRATPHLSTWYKRLARFMPKASARMVVEVVSVRAEQLKDISRGDCMAEGCPFPNMAVGPDPRPWFADLWEAIHGPGSWERDRNKWVWVVEFRRVRQCD